MSAITQRILFIRLVAFGLWLNVALGSGSRTDEKNALGPKFAVIKKGEHGGLLVTGEQIYPFPAYPLATVVDPTGAGDSFAGGFMGRLARTGQTDTTALRQAVTYGTATASYACEGVSLSRLTALTDDDIAARANDFAERLQIPQ